MVPASKPASHDAGRDSGRDPGDRCSAREAGREHPSRINSEPAPGVLVRGRSGDPSTKPAREAGRADCDVPSLFGSALWVSIPRFTGTEHLVVLSSSNSLRVPFVNLAQVHLTNQTKFS
jgi:hypothetical protein